MSLNRSFCCVKYTYLSIHVFKTTDGDFGNAGENFVQIGSLSVCIKEGDLLEEDADCIVTSIPLSMDLRKG